MAVRAARSPAWTQGAFFHHHHHPRICPCSRCLRSPAALQYASAVSLCLHSQRRRRSSSWVAAATAAQQIANNSAPDPTAPISVDPLRSVAKEMKFLTKNIRQLLGSGHPTLDTVARYYTQSEGKYIRPTLVLLMSRALATVPGNGSPSVQDVDRSISPPGVLVDENPSAPENTPITSQASSVDGTYSADDSDILPSQRRLAEITELIHTASLLHDDVIDRSRARRGAASANVEFGNKMTVLAGDFLLGRASVALARLRDAEVTELMATVIANLIEGEFMQLKNTARDEAHPCFTDATLAYYLQKTYLKSASLISKSCRSTALLAGANADVTEAAYQYGRNIGMAFQLVDDVLDYTVSADELGKPTGTDLELGLATAPLLFAWKENPQLGALVGRKFSRSGDVQIARELVACSTGLDQTRELAQQYVDNAIQAIDSFPASEAKAGLVEMCTKVTKRRK